MRKILLVVIMFIYVGCGDKKEANNEESQPQITITPNAINLDDTSLPASYDMDGNKRVNLAIDGEDSILTRELGARASVKNNYDKVSKELLGKRLSRNYFLKCSSCHDDYANGVVGPSLLNKSSAEIFDMIKAYKTRSAKNVLMEYLVSQMGDDEIRSLADEIANFNAKVRAQNESR